MPFIFYYKNEWFRRKKDESEHLCKTCPKGFEILDKLKKHERTHDGTECLYPQCGILIVGKFILYVLCLWNVFVLWVTHLIVFELSLTPSNN